MLKYLIALLLVPGMAFAQQYQQPHNSLRGHGINQPMSLPDFSTQGAGGSPFSVPNVKPPEPLFEGPLTPGEVDLIAKALDRMKAELAADPKTVAAAESIKLSVLAAPHETLADIRALPTIGLALGRATNVEVDRIDEHGVTVIDNVASREASKPYCDLFKKINPQAGCTRW